MNLFNQINCRLVDSEDKSDYNIFRTINQHYQFLIVLGGEFAIQHFMVIMLSPNKVTSQIFMVGQFHEGSYANLVCYILGATSLLVNLIVKKIPVDKFNSINDSINLEFVDQNEWINVQM